MRFAYADPPYPGKAGYYDERREVDHASLVDRLATYPDGWALSTSSEALRDVLSLCPPEVRVCIWVKARRVVRSRWVASAFEPLLICRGRRRCSSASLPAVSDVLTYRGRYRAFPGAMIGMKPPQFSVWMFELLGAAPGDVLADLYPGSGAVSLAWNRYTSLGSTRRLTSRQPAASLQDLAAPP